MEPDRIGNILGNYRLLEVLGSGGFATVYLGEHTFLKSQAAVKVLKTLEQTEKARDKFLKEARTIARLSHPNIIRVIECGVDVTATASTPYIVMSYVSRGNVQNEYTPGGILPLPIILSFTKTAAAALQYAHDQGIVHCDVKPENMLLGGPEQILLSDFGIANISHTVDIDMLNSNVHSDPIISTNIEGTLTYMAPERLQGQIRRSSDQYSLAIVVYEWLTGEPPFTGTRNQILYQHLTALPEPLVPQNAQITPAIEQVVLKALQKEPGQRYANVKEFAQALEQAIITSPAYISTLQTPNPPISEQEEPLSQFDDSEEQDTFDIASDPHFATSDIDIEDNSPTSSTDDVLVVPSNVILQEDFTTDEDLAEHESDSSTPLLANNAISVDEVDEVDEDEDIVPPWSYESDASLSPIGTTSLDEEEDEDVQPAIPARSDKTWTGIIRVPLEDLDDPQTAPQNLAQDASNGAPNSQTSSAYNQTAGSNMSSQGNTGLGQQGATINAGFAAATYSRDEERQESPLALLQARVAPFTALDSEFSNQAESRQFRRLGWIANSLCPPIFAIITHDLKFLLGMIALFLFWLCIHLVSRFSSLFIGLFIAICWGGMGILLAEWLQRYPTFSAFPPQILGVFFLVISAIIHIYYTTHRLEYE